MVPKRQRQNYYAGLEMIKQNIQISMLQRELSIPQGKRSICLLTTPENYFFFTFKTNKLVSKWLKILNLHKAKQAKQKGKIPSLSYR